MSGYRLRVIGANIVYIRLIKNISQEELAYSAGLTQGYLSKLERAKLTSFSIQTLFNIADALSVEPAVLLKERKDDI